MAWDVCPGGGGGGGGGAKMPWDVLSRVTKNGMEYFVPGCLSYIQSTFNGVANPCGMFCPGCQNMAWDVLSQNVLSYIQSKVL